MKIFKSVPNDSTQWRSDSPSVKAMRLILPVAATLSAVSLAGGLSSFLGLNLSTNLHLIVAAAFVVAAYFFDGLGISSARSVVRDFILSSGRAPDPEDDDEEPEDDYEGVEKNLVPELRGYEHNQKVRAIERDTLFWVSVSLAAVIAVAVVVGSFRASQNGIRYLVLEYRKAQELKTETDTTLTATIGGATDQNAAILEAKREAYEAQRAAIVTAWDGKIKAVTVEIGRRRSQRTESNFQYIDNLVAKLEKQRAELEGKKGEALAGLAAGFADEQARLLATTETLTAVTVDDAKAASERRKKEQAEKDTADKELSNLVSAIFSWSVVLMLVIGVRLELLEVRNGILPNPILSNVDLSGLEDLRRFAMAIPYFLFSWVHFAFDKLYDLAAKRRPPVVDNDLVDYSAAQIEVQAIRKEGKIRHLPGPPARRAIGYGAHGHTGTETGATFTEHKSTSEEHEIPDTKTGTDYTRSDLLQKLKMYQKRYAKHTQKKIKMEKKGEPVPKRTLDAIENNAGWIQHYSELLNDLESR